MHLSMKGCMYIVKYSQSGQITTSQITTGQITASQITNVVFSILLRSEDQSNGTSRTVLVSCLLST